MLRLSRSKSITLASYSSLSPGTTVLDDDSDPEPQPSPTTPPHPAGIQLTRSEYYTIPSLEELGRMTDADGCCKVENLTIGREGYGSVFFPGELLDPFDDGYRQNSTIFFALTLLQMR